MVTIESGKLGELFEIKHNKMPIKNNEMIVFLGMEDVSEDGKIISQHVMPFSEIKKGLTYFEKNDILVAKITPCFENGKGAILDTLKTEKGFGSTEFYVLRAKKNAEPRYIFYHTQTEKFRKKLESEMTGTAGQKRVPISAVINYPLSIVHSKIEQQAIASALSDADALITSLEQLITKKRNIKQGAMQQLLTGKKRLPGFRGEWEEKELAEFGTFRGGSGFPIKYQGQLEGEYPFYKVSDMNNKGNEVFMSTSNNYISENIRKLNTVIIFPKDTIVFAKIGAAIFLERKKILSQDSCIDNNMMGFIIDHSKCNTYFFYFLFHSIKLSKLVSTTALPSLSGNEIGKLRLKFPSLPEQQAIAHILSDMDAEIEALEQKRDKYRALKQGMMQELLTGKTRLLCQQ